MSNRLSAGSLSIWNGRVYILSMSIGSGSIRLSRLEDTSVSGSLRSRRATSHQQNYEKPANINTMSHQYAKCYIQIGLWIVFWRLDRYLLNSTGTEMEHLYWDVLAIEGKNVDKIPCLHMSKSLKIFENLVVGALKFRISGKRLHRIATKRFTGIRNSVADCIHCQRQTVGLSDKPCCIFNLGFSWFLNIKFFKKQLSSRFNLQSWYSDRSWPQ